MGYFLKVVNFGRAASTLVVFLIVCMHWDADKFLVEGGRTVREFFSRRILSLTIAFVKMCEK